ncbi:MAG TPA: carbonic anhydrase [Acidimicrobiales bacterium]|nr:carbonic anhydrase [Acidimicrobiales bacterium]
MTGDEDTRSPYREVADDHPEFEDLLAANRAYVDTHPPLAPVVEPVPRLVVLTCIDARIDPVAALGLPVGYAQIFRNPGGLATEEAPTALALSLHWFGNGRVVVMHHTDCGLTKLTPERARRRIREGTGADASGLAITAIGDADERLREDVALVRSSPFVRVTVPVIGLMFDVTNGRVAPLLWLRPATTIFRIGCAYASRPIGGGVLFRGVSPSAQMVRNQC